MSIDMTIYKSKVNMLVVPRMHKISPVRRLDMKSHTLKPITLILFNNCIT